MIKQNQLTRNEFDPKRGMNHAKSGMEVKIKNGFDPTKKETKRSKIKKTRGDVQKRLRVWHPTAARALLRAPKQFPHTIRGCEEVKKCVGITKGGPTLGKPTGSESTAKY